MEMLFPISCRCRISYNLGKKDIPFTRFGIPKLHSVYYIYVCYKLESDYNPRSDFHRESGLLLEKHFTRFTVSGKQCLVN